MKDARAIAIDLWTSDPSLPAAEVKAELGRAGFDVKDGTVRQWKRRHSDGESKDVTAPVAASNVTPQAEAAAVWVDPRSLRPWARNPRVNDGHPVEAVADSIRKFGWGAPLLVRRATNEIIGGHTRLKAALSLGETRVPVRFLDIDEHQAHMLAIADNKIGELASWDYAMLADLAGEIDLLEAGFDAREIDELLAELEPAGDWGSSQGEPVPRDVKVQAFFSVSDVAIVERAIDKAMADADEDRGAALALICAEWLNAT